MKQLSVVVPYKWAPGLPERLQRSIQCLSFCCKYTHLEVEFIVVDWDPLPAQRAASFLSPSGSLRTRIIVVSHEAHMCCAGSKEMPFLEYVAKNVGIRRATHEAVLSTNADIILSEEMVQRLADMSFYPGILYRANRTDLQFEVPPSVDILKMARETATRTVLVQEGAAGDFTLMSRSNWYDLRGYPEFVGADTIDSYLVALAQARGMCQCNIDEPIYHQPHQANRRGWPHLAWNPNLVGVRNGANWGLEFFNFEEVML